MVGGDDRRPVDGAQVGTDIDQDDVGFALVRCPGDHSVESRLGPKCRLVPIHAVRPCGGQPGFETRESEVPDQQPEIEGHFFDVRFGEVADAPQYGRHGTENAAVVVAFGPKVQQPILGQEHGTEVGLRVEVRSYDRCAEFRVHPGQVVDESGLADAALVVEKGDGFHVVLDGMIASTFAGSASSNAGGGLPFCERASWARMTPRPKRFT